MVWNVGFSEYDDGTCIVLVNRTVREMKRSRGRKKATETEIEAERERERERERKKIKVTCIIQTTTSRSSCHLNIFARL